MKIKQLHIFGFGKWIDYEIHFSDEQLLCVYGKNESGKSTIQNFIMFMLFGLPPKKRKYYQPKLSSRMGGRMTLEEKDIGQYTIERLGDVRNGQAICYFSDGEEKDDEWLRSRLKNMTSTTYQAIFSFSALDLVNIKQMKDEDLGDILLTIGLTGYNNIFEIEQQLDRELDRLFKPYGKVPKINDHLNMLDERYKQLTNSKNEEMTYQDERIAYELLATELNTLQTNLQEKQKQKQTIEKRMNSLPIIQNYLSYKRQLNSFSEDISFPERGVERLRSLQEQLLPVVSEHSVYVTNEKKLTHSYEAIAETLLEPSVYDQAKTITKSHKIFENNQQEQKRCQQSINKLHLQIDSQLDQLQIGLTKEDLQTIILPFHVEQQWNMCKQETDRLNNLAKQVNEQKNELTSHKKLLINELDNTKQNILTDQKRLKLQKKSSAFVNYNDQLQPENLNNLKQRKTKEHTNILLLTLFLSGLAGASGYFFNMTHLYSFAIFLIIIGVGQFVWGKRSLREVGYLLQEKNLHSYVSEQEKIAADELLKQDEKLTETMESTKREIRHINMQLLTCEEKLTNLNDTRIKNKQSIQDQYQQYPFLMEIDVKYWPELFYPVRNAIDMVREVTRLTNEMSQLKNLETKLTSELNQLMQDLSRQDKLELSTNKKYEYLISLVSTYEKSLFEKKQLKQKITENKQQQHTLNQKNKVFTKEINTLFAIANVESEEEFYQKEKEYRKKHELTTALAKSKEQLLMNFSLDELKTLIEEKDLNHYQLKNQVQKITEEISKLNDRIDKKRKEQTRIHAQLLKLESSEVFSDLTHRYLLEQEQLNKFAREWAVLKTAKDSLTQTKQSYQNNYLAKVIDQMTIYFKSITNNAYVKIFAPTNDRPFQVESRKGIRYQVNELSQGTIDQLYISLRLAMGEIVSRNQNIPFIIDDAFVHFDSVRLKRILNIIASIAEGQQVIVLTCKQEIVEHLEKTHVVHVDKLGPVRIN